MKQIGLALVQYSQDYDEKMPNGDDGALRYATANPITTPNPYRSLYPYIKSWEMYHCGSMPRYVGDGLDPDTYNNSGYFFSNVVITHYGRNVAAIPEVASLIALQENMESYNTGFLRPKFNGVEYFGWLTSNLNVMHFDGGTIEHFRS